MVVRLKKAHPCGSFEWRIERVGADVALRCQGCGRHQVMIRRHLEKAVKQVIGGATDTGRHTAPSGKSEG